MQYEMEVGVDHLLPILSPVLDQHHLLLYLHMQHISVQEVVSPHRKVRHERIQGRTLMDCLMTVTGQMKVKHPVFALKDLIQISGDDRVMALEFVVEIVEKDCFGIQ